MIEQTTQLLETERIRKEKRAARRKLRRGKITKHCCQVCGKPKHYICLEHNQHWFGEPSFKKFFRKRRYYARKLFFTLAEKLGFVSRSKPAGSN